MKNLLIYINPRKEFDKETKILVKIQIDNSLELGWKREDILLVTNFDYEYNGVKALVIGDDAYCNCKPVATKVTGVVSLFERGLIEKDTLYWLHDFDAYQLEVIKKSEIELGSADMGLCKLGRMPRWAGGCVFFKDSSRDIFEKAKEIIYEYGIVDERAYTMMTNTDKQMKKRIKEMNITYNFIPFNIRSCYKMAIKPIKVIHFHPFRRIWQLNVPNAFDFFMGKNKINKCLVSDRLAKIFSNHGINEEI